MYDYMDDDYKEGGRGKREREKDLRETLNPKQSWNSSMSRFSRVLLPLPEGPAMTSGAGVRPY